MKNTLKATCVLVSLAASALAATNASAADDVVFVRSSSLSLGFDTRSGRVVKVVAADGTDLSPKAGTDLFRMKLTRTDDFSADESVSSEKAARFRHEPIADGLRLVWEDLDGKLSRVECTVRGSATDRKLRFGIALWPTNGWAVTVASYPSINFSGRIGESVEDDRLLTGAKQGVSDNLASLPVNQWHIHPQQPGPLAVQTAFWWDPSLLVYTAAEDDKGDVKCVGAMRTGSGDMQLWWDRKCFDAAPACLDYDFVFAAVCGTKDEPVTWHDGADIYRDWARTTTRLCPVPAWKRSNLPACIAEAPAVTLFNRPWFNDIGKMHRWVGECWSRVAPDVPLVAILWGWERYATWVHPHSFPCNPSDEAFVSLVGDFAAKNVHAFPWPSGYNWTLSYGTNEAGVVQYDWREDFRRRAASHACITRDGKVVERAPYWLHGGAYAKMCGGDEWTRRWFANDVTSELARRGCMIVSVDQNNGGQFDPCWSRSHPHAPGEGRWKIVAARSLLEEMTSAIRKIHGKSAVTYEDPNEHCNDLGSLQLVRDIKWKGEWASVYNYVYHEYMPVFQAEPRSRKDLVWMAYSAAEGQMPRIMPDMRDLEPGGMDGWYFDYMKRWISLFRGEGRPFLAYGRRIKPPRIVCGTVTRTDGYSSPAVFVAAYESDRGEKAVVLVNATHDAQDVQVMLKNRKVALTLAPREIRLLKKQKEENQKGNGNPFAGASWIGENGEKETAWRYEDAKRCRGVSGKKVRVWGEISNPLPKHCPRFRKTFSLGPGPIAKAQVFVTGLGFYELWVNGRKADPLRVLAPGVTSQERVLADKYDVARLLRPGEKNTIGIWLAPGYSDDFSRFSKWVWMAPKRAILKLDVEYADGGRTSVATDGTWETTPESPILYASIYHGEVYDAAREDNAWATPNGKTDGWRAATVFPDGPQTLFFDAPPVRMSDPRPPEKIVETAPGVFTVDFGQNRAGFVAIRAKGPKGTRIRVKTSELLGADGKIDPWTNSGAKSTDEFVLAGTGDVEEYVPRFTYHGFRYAEITGWPGRPKKEDLAAWAVHADVKDASSFRCSDETLMKLYNAARWSMLSNFMSYPSDCCMRDERTPCLMDSQAYEDAACEFFDMRGYYGRWLDDIRHVRGGAPSWTGDAATLPFRLWRYYGDARALERDLETVAAYVDAQMKGHPDYIFTDGHGDWCAPNAGTWKSYFNDVELVSSAIFCSILGQAAEGFKYLGKDKEAQVYSARFEAAKSSFNRKFYDKATHTYGDGSQATAVLPLAFGLVPDGERAAVAAQLVARIRGKDGGKIDTGIFGTRYIGEVLCDLGECDLLMDMYTRTEYPGFGYMFDSGATTLWEQWSFKGTMNSHNHAMMSGGAVWLFTRLAGIRPAKPGYSEVLVKPCYPKGISFAEASRVTPHGEIKVRWDRGADGDVTVRVSIPDGVTSAIFEFPDGRRRELPKGASCIKVAADDVLFVRSSTLSFGFDARDGRVVKVVAADGTDLSPKVAADIFTIKQLTRTDDFSVSESISPQAAAIFRHEPLADGLRLVWEDLGGKLSRVECTVRGSATDRKVRFGLALWPTNGWAVTVASYPCINFSGRIGESIEDDRLLSGSKEHPMPDNIASQPVERGFFYPQQPGPLAVQTAFWWDPSLLVYTAAEDDKGDVKCVGAIRTKSGDMRLWWDRRCFDQAPVRLDYDFVFAAVCGTKDNPVTWHDGADIYRDWARTKTRLCPVPAWKRPDVPACLADASAVTLFNRPWFDDVSKTRRWVDECWSRVAPGAPLVAILWGWENYGTWVNPHSFPCNPSDEAFVSLVRDLAAKNIHAFPWPSGYNWTLSYGTNEAGVVQHDWREDFQRRAAPHACVTCDGKVVERAAYWLKGGSLSKMCGGDDWTVRWFADDVASELAKRGCTMISVDQNKGGRFDPCWSRSHPHTPGEGRWKTVAARRLLEEVSNAVRKEHGKSAVTYEDPNEQFNDLCSLQLMRDVKLKGEWASVYNYVYHEYMPVFQAEPRSRGDLVWMAYSAAEGQMPRIVPYMHDLEPGGGGGWYFDYMKSWISIFRGEGRPFLAYGRRIKPPQVVCGTIIRPDGCSSPAVFVAAYESQEGERAVVLANATHDAQDVQVLLRNRKVELKLAPREIRLLKYVREASIY